MESIQSGSVRLFRAFGISVYLNWTWLIAAWFMMTYQGDRYDSPIWMLFEYVSLFGIVLLHEFGHALACRQVGGRADTIVLWPLGGVAFVDPPPRPGPVLWSIAAGPLVNVLLVPVTLGLLLAGESAGFEETAPNVQMYLLMIARMNGLLLVFNILPIYPLDGGQILQALLWFVIGRGPSLLVVSLIGLIGSVGVIVLVVVSPVDNVSKWWLIILSVFVGLRSFVGFRQAQLLLKLLHAPRHHGLACPTCHQPPIRGEFWLCNDCGQPFDAFLHQGQCPRCGGRFEMLTCPECRRSHPLEQWQPVTPVASAGDG